MHALNLFSIKMSVTNTKSLIVDYVQYQLRKKSLSWPDTNDDGPPPSKVNLTMRVLGEEFKERYTQVLMVADDVRNVEFVLVESERTKITLNKPVVIGFTILEFAKLVMYEFCYDCLLPKFGNKLHLCFSDTDSFICHIETPDLHADMEDISAWFDTSNFRENHFLFSATNKRVLGKFKSETGDCLPQEFCGLRSKIHSLLTLSTDTSLSFVKAKGIRKSYVKKNVRHEQYLHVLNTWSSTKCKFRSFRSKRHILTTREMTKTCLFCIDDKRFLLEDAVHSLAYGHHRIPR